MNELVASKAREARSVQAEWLEDVLAGLLINGVRQDEIEIQYHPDCRIVVVVRGVPKYQHTIKFTVGK